jgi:hypothetical protein
MIRPFLTELALFATPFALYAIYIIATKRGGVMDRANWPLPHVLYLAIVAFLCVIVSFIVLAHWGGAPPGSTYIPAHVDKDGKFIPGETK